MQRHDDRRKEIEGMMAIVAKADATNREQVDKVFAGVQGLTAVVIPEARPDFTLGWLLAVSSCPACSILPFC